MNCSWRPPVPYRKSPGQFICLSHLSNGFRNREKCLNASSASMVSFIWIWLLCESGLQAVLDNSLLPPAFDILPQTPISPLSLKQSEIIPITVDLPAPFGPIKEVTFPLGSESWPNPPLFSIIFLISSLILTGRRLLSVSSRYRK